MKANDLLIVRMIKKPMFQNELNSVWEIIKKHQHQLEESKVIDFQHPSKLQEHIPFDLNQPTNPEELLKLIEKFLLFSVNTQHPLFMNQLFSGLDSWSLIGDFISTISNTTMATYEVAPVATLMEKYLVNKMLSYTGWTKGDGIMVSGGTNANLTAILMSRNLRFPETKTKGNQGQKFIVYVSKDAHYSFLRAMNQLGMGTDNLRSIEVNERGQMKAESLENEIKKSLNNQETPLMVCATSGTTVLGSFDPIEEISHVSKKFNLWLHVDASWGGCFLLSKKHRYLLNGIEKADSISWDPHKMLATGVVSSFFLSAHPQSLKKSHGGGGEEYLFHGTNHEAEDLGEKSLQCGRRNDALKVWLMWKALGDSGVEERVNDLKKLSDQTRQMIESKKELEILYPSMGLNICFRYKFNKNSNEKNLKLRQEILKSGQAMVNFSTREDQTFIRLVFANPTTGETHMKTFINLVCEIGKKLES